jgi:cob(I)alamin adenosyltransferase
MKIYTKTGDGGETGLFGGPRVRKDHPRIEAYGAVDELNAVLGLARCENLPPQVDQLLATVQNTLFEVGAELATPERTKAAVLLDPSAVGHLERAIDAHEAALPPLREFILPGGVRGAAVLHLARTVCRKAERRVVALAATPGQQVAPELVVYLNRLGDLLFVLSRQVNSAAGQGDVKWRQRGER